MKREILFGLLVALFLTIVISPFASPWPDGLEKVAEDKGFIEKGNIESVLHAPIPDYGWPGVKNEGIATSLAGMAGTILVFAVALGIGYMLKAR